MLPDGILQVKVGGIRLELGEIENTLVGRTAVGAASVKVLKHPSTKQDTLVAYYSPPTLAPRDLIAAAKECLPQHMVPRAAVALAVMPLLPSGKVDLSALPAPDWEAFTAGEGYVAPSSNIEQQVHDVWAKVLGTAKIGVHTDFFSAGGTSLLAGIAALQMNDALGSDLAAIDVFRRPTIAGLAAAIQPKMGRQDRIPVAPFSLEQRRMGVPLSISQQQMMALHFSATGLAYNTTFLFRIRAELDVEALRQAWRVVVERHEMLRCTFKEEGSDWLQVIMGLDEANTSIPVIAQPAGTQREGAGELDLPMWINDIMAKDRDVEFDLKRAPLMRMMLFQVGPWACLMLHLE